jgi:hypothetical protein
MREDVASDITPSLAYASGWDSKAMRNLEESWMRFVDHVKINQTFRGRSRSASPPR